jgi:hypothetical protein
MSQNQEKLIRESLSNSVFVKYTDLQNTLKSLPFDPMTPGLFKAISYIDDGIVWAKEVIFNSPLVLGEAKAEEVPTPLANDPIAASEEIPTENDQ